MKDKMHQRVSMLENLGILESTEEATIKLESDHRMKEISESKDMVHQQQQKQPLKSTPAHTKDAKVDQIMIDKRILQLLEIADEELHDGENPPIHVSSLVNPPNQPMPRQVSMQPACPDIQLQPGAYRQGGLQALERRHDNGSGGSIGEESASYHFDVEVDSNAYHDHHGLVSAEPVTLPTFSAELMVDNNRQPPKQDHQSHQLLLLLCACLLLMGVVFLVIFFQDPYQVNVSSSSSINDSVPTSASQTPWTWDMPFSVPSLTVHIIKQDTNRSTPQARAYDWMKNDPNLATYSEERLLQRFIMVLFYYATSGEEWIYQGGGTVTVDISLLQHMPGLSMRQRLLSLQSSSRYLQQQQAANTTSVVPQGSSAYLGSGSSQGGTTGQGHLTNRQPSLSDPFSQHPMGKVNLTSEPWLTYNSSECKWISSSPIRRKGPICSDSNELLYFGLERNNLIGRLPLELVHLTGIKALEMSFNKIGGPVISELGTMSNLEDLLLLRNFLTGTLPTQLGQLKLRSLEIMYNLLTGTIPSSICRMSTLQGFKIGENTMSGSLPNDIGMGLPEVRISRINMWWLAYSNALTFTFCNFLME